MKNGSDTYESQIDSTMSRLETTLLIQCGILAMSYSRKRETKNTLSISCMYLPSQRIWSLSTKLWSKACKFDSIKAVASSRKRANSSLADEDKAKCSFFILTRWNKPCLQKALPTFKEKDIGVCEGCQFRKQHQHLFLKETNVSKGVLNVIHFDVW